MNLMISGLAVVFSINIDFTAKSHRLLIHRFVPLFISRNGRRIIV